MRAVDAERNMCALNERMPSKLEFSLSGAQAEFTGDLSFPTLKEAGTVLCPIASGGLNTLKGGIYAVQRHLKFSRKLLGTLRLPFYARRRG
jgi:hypothetical protein